MVHALWLHQPMCVRSVPIVISVCLACCTDPNYISESVPLGVAQTSEAHPAHHPHPPAPQESEAEAAEPIADAQDRGDCGLDYSGNWEIAISDSEREEEEEDAEQPREPVRKKLKYGKTQKKLVVCKQICVICAAKSEDAQLSPPSNHLLACLNMVFCFQGPRSMTCNPNNKQQQGRGSRTKRQRYMFHMCL